MQPQKTNNLWDDSLDKPIDLSLKFQKMDSAELLYYFLYVDNFVDRIKDEYFEQVLSFVMETNYNLDKNKSDLCIKFARELLKSAKKMKYDKFNNKGISIHHNGDVATMRYHSINGDTYFCIKDGFFCSHGIGQDELQKYMNYGDADEPFKEYQFDVSKDIIYEDGIIAPGENHCCQFVVNNIDLLRFAIYNAELEKQDQKDKHGDIFISEDDIKRVLGNLVCDARKVNECMFTLYEQSKRKKYFREKNNTYSVIDVGEKDSKYPMLFDDFHKNIINYTNYFKRASQVIFINYKKNNQDVFLAIPARKVFIFYNESEMHFSCFEDKCHINNLISYYNGLCKKFSSQSDFLKKRIMESRINDADILIYDVVTGQPFERLSGLKKWETFIDWNDYLRSLNDVYFNSFGYNLSETNTICLKLDDLMNGLGYNQVEQNKKL